MDNYIVKKYPNGYMTDYGVFKNNTLVTEPLSYRDAHELAYYFVSKELKEKYNY